MKRVSTKEFFTVVWSGVCLVLGWFFGLFGYKREGKFAKCVWGMFATSAALIMMIAAGCLVYALGNEYFLRHYRWKKTVEESGGEYVSNRIGYVNFYDENGYLIDKVTGKKILTDIEWIAKPTGNFENGVAQVSWQLNPDGMYYMDEDGYGMTDDDEVEESDSRGMTILIPTPTGLS